MATPLRMGVIYDLRNPPESGIKTSDFYAAIATELVPRLKALFPG